MTTSINGPLWFYRNNEVENASLIIELRDYQANRYCIGCKVTIRHGNELQIREIKAGGGFLSFDAAFAHFGLGQREAVDEVEIEWSTGKKTVIRGVLPGNARYRISRSAAADQGS